MPNVMSTLKAEIARLARKEARALVQPLRKPSSTHRRTLAALKRRIAALEKHIQQLGVALEKARPAQPTESSGVATMQINARGVRAVRRKLRLSQAEFGRLLGVTTNAAYLWEHKRGALRFRDTTWAALLAARQMGPHEAREKLAELAAAKANGSARRKANNG